MKKTLTGLAVAIAVVVIYLINVKRPEPLPVRHEPAHKAALFAARPSVSTMPVFAPANESSSVAAITSTDSAPAEAVKVDEVKSSADVAQVSAPPAKVKKDKVLKDPLARVALMLVGADAEADLYWAEAINDPTLPPEECKDLIEDLNEEGFADPKHPTLDDLPLIVSRLEMIELIAPYAMDQDNFDAFGEAYKDLINMGRLANGGGTPVK